jgi:hypothetical protein
MPGCGRLIHVLGAPTAPQNLIGTSHSVVSVNDLVAHTRLLTLVGVPGHLAVELSI